MKIAITADLHLTTRKDHPERFHALENILEKIVKAKITTLIIAGDLFNESIRNFSEFESVCKDPLFKQVQFHIIPGNHDSSITNKKFTADNVTVYSEPYILKSDFFSTPFLLLPYQKDKTMGDLIAPFTTELAPGKWVLIGHGDWIQGMREANPLEPGVYMPLTRADLESYQPLKTILGHIHKPTDSDSLHYPGSPCPLDITETGKRRFLIFDSDKGTTLQKSIESDVLFFRESFIIYPMENEETVIRKKIRSRIDEWDLSESEKSRANLRIKVRGYSRDKRHLEQAVKNELDGWTFYKDEGPDLSEVSNAEDVDRAEIASRVSRSIKNLDWPRDEDQPDKDQILLEALKVIYGD
ncbi:exonuclease SbcCD subunit D [bacterium]